jgi:tetratricopeptide (TPR) repeat protein
MSHRNPITTLVLTLAALLAIGDLGFAQRGGRSQSRPASSSRSNTTRSDTGSRSSSSSSRSRTRSAPTRTYTAPTPSRSSSSSSSRKSYTPPSSSRSSGSRSQPSRSSSSPVTRPSSPSPQPSTSRMPAYTPPTPPARSSSPTSFDLSRSSADSGRSTLDQASVHISNRAPASRAVSAVPRTYGSPRPTSSSSKRANPSRREALSTRLKTSNSMPSRQEMSPSRLANSYSPSMRGAADQAGRTAARPSTRESAPPGASRRSKLEQNNIGSSPQRIENARSQAKGKRVQAARTQTLAATAQELRSMNRRYQQAASKDEALKQRMQQASTAVATGTSAALRAVFGASAYNGYGNGYGYDNHWNDPYNDCANWYWGAFFPSWSNWWFGHWGWGWGHSYAYYPSYSYWPYRSSYNNYGFAPSYAYCSPAVIYNYYSDPAPTAQVVQTEYIENAPEKPGVLAQGIPTTSVRASNDTTFAQRAATEYMALGDRAFTEGRYGDAVHYYAKSIQFAPQDGVLYLVLSDALFATGDYHYSAFALRRAFEFSPELASLGLDKRDFYGRPGEFDEQLQVLTKFVYDHPIDLDARLVLAANQVFSMQPAMAISTLDQAPGNAKAKSKACQLLAAASAEMLSK